MQKLLNGVLNTKKDFFILRKNKELMADKIMDYSPSLKDGISKYKNVCIKFFISVMLGIIINKYILVSVVCFVAAIYFIILMLKYTKYGTIYKIIKKLACDITFKGIYNKEKIDYMVNNYKKQFGEECVQYKDLCNVVRRYEKFVLKLEYIIRDLEIESARKHKEKQLLKKYAPEELKLIDKDNIPISKNEIENIKINTVECRNDKKGLIYSNEDGKVKEAKKVVDFFSEEEKNSTVVLKNKSERKNLTIFLYKRNGNLQNNAL